MQVSESVPARIRRREQIVEATIEVIARDGVAMASYERIREHAGISSTRLISYHFVSKDELLQAVLEHIVAHAGTVMGPRIAAAGTHRERLAEYIRANVAFLAERPSYAVAAIEVLGAIAPAAAGTETEDQSELLLRRLFDDGRSAGEFRAFDTAVMAATLRAAIDRAVTRFGRRPDTDLIAWGDELVAAFDRAVRADPAAVGETGSTDEGARS